MEGLNESKNFLVYFSIFISIVIAILVLIVISTLGGSTYQVVEPSINSISSNVYIYFNGTYNQTYSLGYSNIPLSMVQVCLYK